MHSESVIRCMCACVRDTVCVTDTLGLTDRDTSESDFVRGGSCSAPLAAARRCLLGYVLFLDAPVSRPVGSLHSCRRKLTPTSGPNHRHFCPSRCACPSSRSAQVLQLGLQLVHPRVILSRPDKLHRSTQPVAPLAAARRSAPLAAALRAWLQKIGGVVHGSRNDCEALVYQPEGSVSQGSQILAQAKLQHSHLCRTTLESRSADTGRGHRRTRCR